MFIFIKDVTFCCWKLHHRNVSEQKYEVKLHVAANDFAE